MNVANRDQKRNQRRPLRIPTPQNLANVALHYLGRYAASEASLRRVLENRIRRVAMKNKEFAEDHGKQDELRRCVEDIIVRHRKTGVLNDTAYAQTKINSLRRAGRSARAIQQKLAHAGVAKDVVQGVLENEDEEGLDPGAAEIKAAAALARRRRLGPFRKSEGDADLYRKDLAAMARAGFSLDIARRVLKGQGAGDA